MTKEKIIKNAIYKLNHQNIPIVKTWIDKELELVSENNNRRAKDLQCVKIATATALAGIANIFLKNWIISSVIGITAIYICAKTLNSIHLIKEEEKFNTAIFSYDKLKKYEELNPEAEKITENKNLKGLTKTKILKITKQI